MGHCAWWFCLVASLTAGIMAARGPSQSTRHLARGGDRLSYVHDKCSTDKDRGLSQCFYESIRMKNV